MMKAAGNTAILTVPIVRRIIMSGVTGARSPVSVRIGDGPTSPTVKDKIITFDNVTLMDSVSY